MTTTAATPKRRNAALRADIKKGLKIAFKHVMYLDDGILDETPPCWYSLYVEWFKSRCEYIQAHKSEWEKQEDKMRPIGVLNASELFER